MNNIDNSSDDNNANRFIINSRPETFPVLFAQVIDGRLGKQIR